MNLHRKFQKIYRHRRIMLIEELDARNTNRDVKPLLL
jgi:hypothetical protein